MTFRLKGVSISVAAAVLGIAVSTSSNAIESELNGFVPSITALENQIPTRYIIKYKKTTANTMMQASGRQVFKATAARQGLMQHGATVHLEMPSLHAVAATMTRSAATAMQNDPSVLSVEIDAPRKLLALYNDDVGNPTTTQLTPYAIYQSQANLLPLQPGIKVCIIDSGIAGSTGETGGKNNDFNWANITGSNDSGTGNWNADGGAHGTHVAGTVAAQDNGFGVIGTAPGVSLHIVKVFNAAGWGYSSDLAQAASECTNAGADIITMSLGGGASNATEENAFNTFVNNGGLVLAAAGNSGNNVRSFPAGYNSIMMVGANDGDNNIASFSQYPSCNTNATNCVEITAGGVNTLSTYPSGAATVAGLSAGGTGFSSSAMENNGNADSTTYFMGTAEAIDNGANGKICMIDRGNISFVDKVKNCEDSGGLGAVIINNAPGVLSGTLGTTNTTTIPAVGAAQEDRAALIAAPTASITVGPGDYGLMSGTSMATPAVAGVAALVWSNHQSCTGSQIRNVLNATAEDSGAAGNDVYFGNGIVKAKAASDYITTLGCDGSGTGGGNTLPVASFTNTCTDLDCTFDGSGSSDSDGSIASYSWNFGDGTSATGATAVHSYATAGAYTAQLTVTDNAGGTNTSSQSVIASDPVPTNVLPSALFTNTCTDLGCSFDASGSSDTDGTITSYAWSYGDGTSGTGVSSSHAYTAAGTYSVQLTVTDNSGGTDSITSSVTVTAPPPVGNLVLVNGVAKTGISGATGDQIAYTMDVPAGATNLSFVMSGGSGDADLYVRFGSAPTTSSYDCRPYKTGNNETCSISNVQAGTYYVMIRAYSTYSGASVTGSFDEAPVGGGQGGSATANDISGARRAWNHYTIDVPAGMKTLSVQMSGGTGDADLYVKQSAQPTTSSYDCRPYKNGNNETCNFSNPTAGTWYISIRGYSAFTGVNLLAEWNP